MLILEALNQIKESSLSKCLKLFDKNICRMASFLANQNFHDFVSQTGINNSLK